MLLFRLLSVFLLFEDGFGKSFNWFFWWEINIAAGLLDFLWAGWTSRKKVDDWIRKLECSSDADMFYSEDSTLKTSARSQAKAHSRI